MTSVKYSGLKTNYHERETITLRAPQATSRSRLDKWFRKRGYNFDDDFYYLPRKGRCEPWQVPTVLSISVRRSGDDIHETDEDIAAGHSTDWDELRCDYLLATLPRESIATFIIEMDALVSEFGCSAEYNGIKTDPMQSEKRLNEIADALAREWDAPGTESLAILIEQQYGPR